MIEEVLTKLKSVLETVLPGELTTIQTEKNDGIVLNAPGSYVFDDALTAGDSLKKPTVFLLENTTPPRTVLGRQGEYKHAIIILLTLEDQSITNLWKKKLRYARAILKVFQKNHQWTSPTRVDDLSVDQIIYSTRTTETPNIHLDGIRIQLTALELESI